MRQLLGVRMSPSAVICLRIGSSVMRLVISILNSWSSRKTGKVPYSTNMECKPVYLGYNFWIADQD